MPMASTANPERQDKGANGRGERIRTSDSCVPNAVLYQTELHPEDKHLLPAAASRRDRAGAAEASVAAGNSEPN